MSKIAAFFSACIIIFSVFISGCTGPDVSDYSDIEPRFDLLSYFEGTTFGRGILFDRSGKMTRQFIVIIEGTTDPSGEEILLDEKFRWSDGELSTRVWTIRKNSDGSYTGSAPDVVGRAGGRGAGNGFNWQYTLTIDVDGSSWDIQFDDWMFLQEGDVVMNRAYMTKFGIRVGELFITFSKSPDFG